MSLELRARSLGDHATLYFKCKQKLQLKRHIKSRDISTEKFNEELFQFYIPQDNADSDTNATGMSNTTIVSMSAPVIPTVDNTEGRWKRLLSDSDDRRMWQAFDSQGK